jgi:geranylgeranyl pyrophosphate synthase|tara:strand:+ start:29793 stop:30683 length:891 start_codon:yes stop_codon:yes gene_type:complete
MPTGSPENIIDYRERINSLLDISVPISKNDSTNLNAAMRYSVINGGKRIRPLLIYTSGFCFNIKKNKLDVPAIAIELLHSFSLVHDDLPSMDDDDLRRGQPTTHKKFSEATAILAADALQTLAFEVIADSKPLNNSEKVQIISLISGACGSSGMTGGQSIDLASEGKVLNKVELHKLHSMKTAALIHASIMSPFCLIEKVDQSIKKSMSDFGWSLGMAFQIRDDLLDIEESTEKLGKTANSDLKNKKATWPAMFGIEESYNYCDELLMKCMRYLDTFDTEANSLRWLTNYLINRHH